MLFDFPIAPVQKINHPAANIAGIEWYVKRDDLYGPGGKDRPLQGNKVRKLAGHLLRWQQLNKAETGILSFGGAYSNHLIALAIAGQRLGIQTRAIVRGEVVDNPTLSHCKARGMQLHFVSRAKYRRKNEAEEIAYYQQNFGDNLIVPEGGSGLDSHLGCQGILPEIEQQLAKPIDYFQLAAGTGGTAAGVIGGALNRNSKVEVFPVLKGSWMKSEIQKQLPVETMCDWNTVDNYHFGGYAKRPQQLLDFCSQFKEQCNIPTEPIYTGKLFFGVLDRIKLGFYPPGSTLVTYHSGGIY